MITPCKWLLFPLAVLCILPGCDQATPVTGHGPMGSFSPNGDSSYRVQWTSLDAQRHLVLDDVFMALSDQQEGETQFEQLLLMMVALEPDSPCAWSRLALMRLRLQSSVERFKEVFEITKKLSSAAPTHPDRLFLEGYLRWFALRGGIGANSRELAEQSRKGLQSTWGKLLELHPSFRGPHGFDASRIRGELAMLLKSAPDGVQ